MNVRFTTTTSAKLSDIEIINGQLIYLSDKDAAYYDMGNSRKPVSSVKIITSGDLPGTGQSDIIYIKINAAGRADAWVWNSATLSYAPLSGYLATTTNVGLVKPDGTTITISADGTLSSHPEVVTLPASSITYINTTSGLQSTEVQSAIDELSESSQAKLTAGDNITIINNRISAVDTTYQSMDPVQGGTAVSLVTTGEKYIWNSKAAGDHTHPLSLAESDDASSIDLEASTKYMLTAGSSTYVFQTPADTTYTPASVAPGNVAASSSVGTSDNYARQDHTHGIVVATGDSAGQVKIAGQNVSVNGLGSAAFVDVTDTYDPTSTDAMSGVAVASAIEDLPEPMIFKGSLGEGGTISTLPAASSANEGFTYKVITAGTYASQSAKVGDTFISDGTDWVLIPSGDEPSGTVTSISTGAGLTGGPVTSSGTIKANLVSETALASTAVTVAEVADRVYPVALDAGGRLAVNVPWSGVTNPEKLGFGYARCTTAGATTEKAATITDYQLVKNGYVTIKFNNAVPADSTLNISSQGAKAIYYKDVAITSGIINAKDTATFVYDGTHYQLVSIDTLVDRIAALESAMTNVLTTED